MVSEVDGARMRVPVTEESCPRFVTASGQPRHCVDPEETEYPVVVLPLLTQHYMLLQRNLLYTAITRAKRMVVIVGTRKAMAMAVKNDRIAARSTALQQRLDGPEFG